MISRQAAKDTKEVVAFPASILPKEQEAAIRGEFEDALTERLEGEKIGRMLGGALGTRNAYLDWVIFDRERSLETIQAVIASHQLQPKIALLPVCRG
jgi:hypothetical protein